MGASPSDTVDKPLSFALLGAYGSLAFPLAAGFIALQVVVPTFYAQALGISLTAVGAILLGARLWDMITDPVIGFLSDKTPPRYGRRRAWVVVSAPLVALSVWMLFNPAVGIKNGYLLLWAMAIYVAGTMAIVPMTAWGAELSTNYHQRSRVAGTRVVFGLLGTMSALLLVDNRNDETLASSLNHIALLVTAALLVTVPLAAMKVPDSGATATAGNDVRGAWALLRSPSPFRRLLLAFLLNGVANAIPATLFLMFVTHVLQQPELAGPALFLYFLCSAVSVPFWVWAAGIIGKHQAWSIAVTLACLFFAGVPFLDVGDSGWYIAIVVATGLLIGADLALPSAINGDLIEWDAHENGKHRPGLFFALWGSASKLAFALAVGMIFPLLDLVGFDASGSNSQEDVRALAILYGVPSILFKLAAVALMFNFPIDEQEHQRIRNALSAKTAAEPA